MADNEQQSDDLESRISRIQEQIGRAEENIRGVTRIHRAMQLMAVASARHTVLDPKTFDADAVARDAFALADAFGRIADETLPVNRR